MTPMGSGIVLPDDFTPTAMLEHAASVQHRMRCGGRWYPVMMLAFGVVSMGLVACVPVVRSTWAGVVFVVGALGWAVVMFVWKHGQDVRPASRRDTRRWLVPWLVLYAAAVFGIGPTYLDRAVGAWVLMGAVVAAPAFGEAARAWRQLWS